MLLVLTPHGHLTYLLGFRQQEHGIRQFLVADGSLHVAGFRHGGRVKLIAHVPIATVIGACPLVLVGMNQRFADRHMVFGAGDDAVFLRLCHRCHRHQADDKKYNLLHNLCLFLRRQK